MTSDIEHNVKEQERISADIAALQERLTTLQHDHSVLVNVRQALGIASTPVQPVAAPDNTTAVPAPRGKTPAVPEGGKRTRTKKAATDGQEHAAVKRPAPKKPASKAADAKAPQLTLVELVRRHLTEQGEPRSAAEVATALETAYAERGIRTAVVRTTLENLVAKNQAQRTKQGSSVYYTAPAPAKRTAAAISDEAQAE
ncbi:hypothetical protein ABZX69_33200 [Streptomyces sp. NPDC004074]|uniref:hypothetical protein n=1 Tax=Streptomyces sp. NPDC004074 TaxID=3154277 RepID=UPI0033BE7F5B